MADVKETLTYSPMDWEAECHAWLAKYDSLQDKHIQLQNTHIEVLKSYSEALRKIDALQDELVAFLESKEAS